MKTNMIIAKNSFKIYAGIALFFLIMKIFGLEDKSYLRMLNFIIVLWGINSAIKTNITKNHDTQYFSNLMIGFATSLFSVLASAISLLIYIKFISPNFIHVLESSQMWGDNLSLTKITIVIFFEGFASSMISTFIIMQYWKSFKNPQVEKDGNINHA